MRLLVHRGQALLLLVVGGLAGAAVAAAVLEWDALPSPVAATTIGFLTPSRSHLPDRIEIGPSRPPTDGSGPAAAQPDPAPVGPPAAPSGRSVQPSPPTTVVPATVYSYPPDDGATRGSGGSGPDGGSDREGHG
ncbi:MAG TPA: hypothetical protein VLW53_08410 [Candidatus Eisenbacteria bacterium]|nr:hypothetical protein [Candidatus Eisenbacteria bacterium]